MIGVVVLITLLIAIPVSSFLTKYLIQKYDLDLTGREITLDWAYTNPYTGFIHLDDLVIHEEHNDSTFIAMSGLSVNVSMLKLFSRTYEVEAITLDRPFVYIRHGLEEFNFSDLIAKFTSDSTAAPAEEPVRFNLLNISIVDGEFHYNEVQTPVNYFINKVNIESEGLHYDVDTLPIQFAFSSGVGSGDVDGDMTINLANQNYRLAVLLERFDLELINQYLQAITNYGELAAMLDAEINSTGNFASVDSISTSGKIVISDFHFGKNRNDDFASFEQLVIDIVELSPKDFVYHYDSIALTKPFIRYELYDSLDNFQTMFGEGGENVVAANADPNTFNLIIEVAKLVEQLSRNLLRSHYKIGRLAIYDADLQFSDYSVGEKFHVGLNPFTVIADSVDKERERIEVKIESSIDPHGEFWVNLSVNPEDSSYFDLDYRFHKIPLTLFNPYIKTYTSYPLNRGSMEFVGSWRVRAGEIDSDNHLIIIDPRTSKRVRNKDTKWIPIPLAMAVVRERGNVIDYEIPVTGNLNDPKFNFCDVITDVLANIFIKPATIPYRMEVKNVEQELEKSLFMKWELQEDVLSATQEEFIDKMIEFLKDNPEAHITIAPQHYKVKEQEFILLYQAKKRYFLDKHQLKADQFSINDSVEVQKMSIKDDGFVAYLDDHVEREILFTVQHKALRLIEQALIDNHFDQLVEARQDAFLAYFEGADVNQRVKFLPSAFVIPFNGFSFYEISYEGDFPDYLRDAHNKMNALDDQAPRLEYRSKREKVD